MNVEQKGERRVERESAKLRKILESRFDNYRNWEYNFWANTGELDTSVLRLRTRILRRTIRIEQSQNRIRNGSDKSYRVTDFSTFPPSHSVTELGTDNKVAISIHVAYRIGETILRDAVSPRVLKAREIRSLRKKLKRSRLIKQ